MITEVPFGSPQQLQSIALRNEVLRKPLGLHFSPEELQAENHQIHIVAIENQLVIGVLLLVILGDSCKMRQVAVASGRQGEGIGEKMVRYSETSAVALGIQQMELHARESAVNFYLKLGYVIVGEKFEEVGIPHFRMKKNLNPE